MNAIEDVVNAKSIQINRAQIQRGVRRSSSRGRGKHELEELPAVAAVEVEQARGVHGHRGEAEKLARCSIEVLQERERTKQCDTIGLDEKQTGIKSRALNETCSVH